MMARLVEQKISVYFNSKHNLNVAMSTSSLSASSLKPEPGPEVVRAGEECRLGG